MKKLFVITAALFALASGVAQAVTYTWDGGGNDSNWMTASNWVGDTIPVSSNTTTLLFLDATGANSTNNFPDGTLFQAIQLSNTANYVFSGNRIVLGDAGGGSTIFDTGTTASNLTVNFDISVNEGVPSFVFRGGGTLNGLLTNYPASPNPNQNFVFGGGNRIFLNNTNNSFVQGTDINGNATLIVSQWINSGLKSQLGAGYFIKLGNAGSAGTIEYTGPATSTDRQILMGDNANTNAFTGSGTIKNNGTGALVFTRPQFISPSNTITRSARSLTLGGTFTGDVNVVQGIIADNNTNAPIRLIKTDASVWQLDGTNTYTGGTTLIGGTLKLGHVNALGTGALTNTSSTAVLGTTADLSAGVTNSIGLGQTLTVQADQDIKLSGAVSGSGGLTKTGSSTLTLSGANSYSGGTTVNEGTLKIGATDSLSTTNDLTVKNGTLDLNGYDQTVNKLVLGGAAGTAVVSTGSKTLTLKNGVNVTYSATGNPNGATVNGNLTVLTNGGNAVFAIGDSSSADKELTLNAVLNYTGAGSIYKAGTGTMLMNASNVYTQGTILREGTLIAGVDSLSGQAGAFGNSTLNVTMGDASSAAAVTLLADSGVTVGRNLVVNSGGEGGIIGTASTNGTATFSGNVTASHTNFSLTAAAGGTAEFTGVISGAGNMTKIGGGIVQLKGTNTYTGTTAVSNGTLVVDGKLAGDAVTVDAGATLAGSGTIGGATTVNGNLNPGNSPGTLTFNDALNLEASSVTTIQIASNVLFDVLKGATSNTLTFAGGADVIFDFTGNTTVSNGSTFAVLQNWISIVTNGANFATVGLSNNLAVDLSALLSGGLLTVYSSEQYTTKGTPYSWLAGYGLTNYVTDDVLDQDTDGLKAWQEYIAGTDPTKSASCFKVAQITCNTVTWIAQSNRIYSVYWSTNLVQGFTNLNNSIVYPQSSYTNASPNAKGNHYQIRVRLP